MPDPILDLILRRKSAKNKLSGPSNRTMTMASPAFEYVNSDDVVNNQFELDDINTQISSFGFNPDIAESKIGDLPDYTPDFIVRDVLNTDNPVELSRMKAAIKWKAPVVKAIEGIGDPISRAKAKEEFTFVTKGYQGAEGEKSNYYQNAISSTKAAADIIKKFNGSGDTTEMLKNLRTDSEYGLAQAMLQDPSAQQRWADLGLNPIQGIALDIKEIFEANGAEYKKQITSNPTEFKAIAEQNIKKAELERTGTSILGGEIDYLLDKKKVAVKKANDFYTANEDKMSKLTETIKADKNLTEEMKSKLSGFQIEYDDAVMGFEGKFVVSPYNFDVLKEKVESNTANSFEIKEYNNRVGKLNGIVKKYKGEFDQYNQTATQQNAAVREYNKIVNTIQDSYKDVVDHNNLASWAEYLAQKRNTLGQRYPEYKQIELEGLVKDIAGDNVGLGEKTVFRLASSIGGEAIDGLNKVWNNLTIWNGDKLREVEMGDAYSRRVEDVMYGYETGDQMLKDERSIIPVAPKDVQDELNKIKNSNLSDEEKYQKNYAIVSKAFDGKKIQYVANPKYGKYNLTAGAILNTVSSVTSQFIGQMAQSYLSGGFGNVSKLRRLLTLFGTTAAQAFSREYDAAVQRGDSSPFEQATTKSFIEGLSELPFDNIQFVKNMSPQFRRIAGDMTEAEWKAIKAVKLPNNIGRQFVGAVESLTKEGALEEGLAQVGGNLADKYLFGKDVDLTEGLDVAMLAGTIGFAPLTMIGLPIKYRSANMGNKLMMYQTGYKADQVIESLNRQVADGDITAEEAKQRIESVKLMKEVVGGMSMYDVNGKPLTDNQKAQFAWNEYTKLKAKNIESLPQQQRQDVEQVVQEADQSSSNILNGTDNATYESTRPLQGMPAEGNLEQPQTVGEGQPGQTQTTQPTANVGYSDISGQEVDLQEAPKGLTEVATKVFNDAIQTAKSLMKTGIKVRVFENQADFERESTKLGQRARGQGVFMSDGKNILINLSKIKNSTDWGIVWHEGTHPVMNIIRNTNPELYDKMAKGFGGLAKQGGVFAQIEGWAQADYGGKTDLSTDEAMVETVSLIGDGKIGLQDIPVSFRQQVIDFVNQVADYLGLGQLADTSERVFIQKAAQIAQTLRSGGEISSVVGEPNIQRTENPFAQQKIDSRISDEGVKVERKEKIPLAIAPSKEAETMSKIDNLIATYPNALTDRNQWAELMSRVFSYEGENGQVLVPAYPEGLGRMASSVDEVLKELAKVSPEQRKLASEGLKGTKEIGELFGQGKMDEVDTGLYFLWNIMSIGISPYPQESGFLQAINAGVDKYLQAAAVGNFDNNMLNEYLEWVNTALPLGTPGAGSKSNLNAFGKSFLYKASEVIEQGEFAAKTKLQALHNILSDRSTPTNELRRKWQANMSSMSFNNKIFDFILLTTGRSDLFVIDRVRVDHFWDGDIFKKARGLKSGTVIYDGAELTYKASSGAGFSKMLSDVPGLIFAELANRTMTPVVKEAYEKLGVTDSPDVGRFHWETWVAASAQEVSHGSIDAIVQRKESGEITDAGIRQGKYGAWDFNFTYRKVKGQPFRYEFTDNFENVYIFDEIRFVKEEIDNQSKKNYGTEETRFLLADNKGNIKRPTGSIPSAWYDQPGVDSQKYFDFLRSKAKEVIPAPDVIEDQAGVEDRGQDRNSSVFAAPFYDLSLRDQPGSFTTKADEARGTEAYQQYENNIKEVAQLLNITLEDVENLIGGFENEQGKKIVEVAAKSNIEVDDFNKAIQFAAILGAIAPETQESTIAARYVEEKTPDHNADEYVLQVSNPDLAIQALTDIGVYNFSVNEKTNEVTLLNIFAYPTENIKAIVNNFESKLKEYGVEYTIATKSAIQSEYIDYNRRKDIISTISGDAVYGQAGQRLRDVIAQAEQRNEKFIRSKQGQSRRSAVVLAEMDSIVADAKANGSYLIAPNEMPTKLTPDQWAETRTQNFKNWFGDWENDPDNASKVVDENGEPLVVYHGFTEGAVDRFKDVSYFAYDKDVADTYGEESSGALPYYISLKNPLVLKSGEDTKALFDNSGASAMSSPFYPNKQLTAAKWVADNGYDGIMVTPKAFEGEVGYIETEGTFGNPQIVTTKGNQIKSAIDNTGRFSTTDNRMQERKSAVEYEKDGDFYIPTNVEMPKGFRIVSDKGYEGWGYLYDNNGQLLDGLGSVKDHIKTIKDRYPVGTKELKDATTLDILSNVDRFTTKQLAFIMSKEDPNGTYLDDYKMINKAASVSAANKLEEEYLSQVRDAAKKYFKESLTDDSYDDIRGYDVPADGLGAETIIKNNPNNSATDNKNQNRNSASKINLAPNGKPSKLTPKQYEQVRTPEFKNWFGDWENDPENSSKVVDKETREPLVVFHGSVASDIEVFDRDLSKRQSSGLREMGYYFTTNKDLAELYSEATPKEGALNADGKIYEAFLNLKKVKEFDAKGKNGIRAWDNLQVDAGYKLTTNRDAMDFLMNGKFGVDQVDGIIARNITDMESYGAKDVNEEFKGTVYLVFDDKKNSIKSATNNTGAFSTTDNRIQERESSAAESINVYHGGEIRSTKDIDDSVPFFVTENKTEAGLYAEGNSGNVSTFKISNDKIADDELVYNILRNLGFSEDKLMYGVHEFVDPRFEESYIGKENVDKLFRLIKNAGFDAVRFTDAGLGAKKYVQNILLVDPKNTIENSGVAQYKNSSVQLLNDAIQNRKSAAQITSKAVNSVKDLITRLGYGHLPEDVQERLKKKQRLIDADMNDMNVLSQRLEQAVKGYYGVSYKKLDADTKALLDKALRNFEGLNFPQKMAEQAKIPDSVFTILGQMRASVDAMSLKLIDIGVLDDSLEPAFDGDKGLGVYLNRTYQKYDDPEWINKIPEPVRNRAIEYLKANTFVRQFDDQGDEIDERELTDEEVEGLINYIATNMQPVNEGLASANAGKTKVDILKGRKIIPEEIRDLMGEYKDPMVNFARSIAKMANLVHTHHALKAIAETNMGTLFFERPTGKNFTPIAGEGKTYLQPLSGLFTTPEIADAFKQVSANFEGDDVNLWFLRTLASINGIAKVGKTALSPASWVRNVIGGHIIMLKDGHLFGSGYADGWGKALGYFVNKSKNDPAFQAKIREYIENGILGDGVQSGEFQAIVRAAQKHDSPVEWLKNDSMLGKGINLVKGFYSAQDDIFRVYAYENEKTRLAKRKKNMNEAQLQAEASRKARATYPTYSELPEVVRQLAKFIPISSFPAFSAELIRTTKNSFKIAFEEIGDPEMRDVGVKRLAGVISAISFGSILSGLSAMLIGVDGEEEKNIRRYLPEWSKNSPLIWLGRDDNGMPKYIDLGFSDVFSYFKKPVVALRNEDNDMTDRIKNAVGEIAAPFISPEIFLSAMIKGTKKLKETDDLDEVMGKYAGPVYEALEPGLVASLRRIGKGFIGDVDRYGQQYDPKLELLAFFSGQRIKKMDVPVGFSFKSRDFMTAKRDIMSGYYTERAKTEGDPEKQADELADANKKLSKYFDGYKKDYYAASGLMTRNMTAREAKKILKNTMKDRNIPNDFIKAIEKNKPYPIIEDDK